MMPVIHVMRVPDRIEDRIQDEVAQHGSDVHSFILFCVVFYLELIQGEDMAYDNVVRGRFMRLAATGMSLRKVEDVLGISHGTAVAWNKKFAGQICEMSNGDLDAMLTEWSELRNQRIGKLAMHLMVMEEDLLTRDLSEIPTKVLLKLVLDFRQELRESVEPQEVSLRIAAGVNAYQTIVERCFIVPEPDQS